MDPLRESKSAADQLPLTQKRELLHPPAIRLQATGAEPLLPRTFTKEQIQQWIAEDEDGYRSFLAEA